MDKKKQKPGELIIAVILAVGIMLSIAFVLFMNISYGAEKLESDSKVEKTVKENSEEVEPGKMISSDIGSFSVGREEVVSSSIQPADSSSGEYLCAFSSEREITADDVNILLNGAYEGLPVEKSIIQMVINEMYARYGYQFTSVEIQNYFNNKTWYQNIAIGTTDMDSIYNSMTDIEKKNIEFLKTQNQ